MSIALSPALPRQLGRYTLLESMAVGGMAEVFRAKITSSHGFEKLLVIKRILPHLAEDPAFVSMFVDEAKLTAQLAHQKIVQVLDFGDVDGEYFIALELIHGFDALWLLRTCAEQRQRMPPHLAMYVITEVLEALDYAHSARDEISDRPMNIVHRDISPSNIFISKRGEVKLGDFGIASAQLGEAQPGTDLFKGKVGYMSPEQLAGDPLDGRSDLFAVGIVLAELCMGRRLFVGQTDTEARRMVREARLERLDKHGADLHPTLDRILRRALRPDPRERFASAAEFRDQLADHLLEVGHRVGPADLREFVDDLGGAAAKPVVVDLTALAAARPGRSRRPTMVELAADGATVAANYEARTIVRPHGPADEETTDLSPVPTVIDEGGAGDVTAPTEARDRRRNLTRPIWVPPPLPPERTGDLGTPSPMRVLCDLAMAHETGVLRMERSGAIKEIFLLAGTPQSVRSNAPGELFGEYLVAKGVIAVGDLDGALALSAKQGRRLGDVLVALGLLRPLDVFRLLSQQVRDRVIDALGWSRGRFAFYRGVTNPGESFPLELDTFEILGAGVTTLGRELLDRWFAPVLDRRPARTSSARLQPEAFRVGSTPREVMELLDGERSIDAWIDHFGDETERLTLLRSLYLLVETGLAELR